MKEKTKRNCHSCSWSLNIGNSTCIPKEMRALVFGGTGAVGQCVVRRLLEDQRITCVSVIGRKPLEQVVAVDGRPVEVDQSKLQQTIIPSFEDTDSLRGAIQEAKAQVVVCCLGTTLKQCHGDKEMFTRVDHDYVMTCARETLALACPTRHFAYCSSAGADSSSNFFYLKTKGTIEENLQALGFPSLSIYRPGALLGARRKETRMGESIFTKVVAPLTGWIYDLVPPLKRYKNVHVDDVARAMVTVALEMADKVVDKATALSSGRDDPESEQNLVRIVSADEIVAMAKQQKKAEKAAAKASR